MKAYAQQCPDNQAYSFSHNTMLMKNHHYGSFEPPTLDGQKLHSLCGTFSPHGENSPDKSNARCLHLLALCLH